MVFRFGPYQLNATRFELRRSGRTVHLASRPMELLLLLVQRRDELVSREEIARALWPGLNVEDLVDRINTAVGQIRAAIQEDSSKPRYIQTVIGKGYRFIGRVEQVVDIAAKPPAYSPTPTHTLDTFPVKNEHSRDSASDPANVTHANPGSVAAPSDQTVTIETPALPSQRSQREMLLVADLPLHPPLSQPTRTQSRPWRRFGVALALLASTVVIGVFLPGRRPHAAPQWESVQMTTNDVEHPVAASAISPDERLLAYSDASGTYLREISTGRARLIPSPTMRATRLAWLPDQSGLVLTGFPPDAPGPEIWTLFAAGGPPRLLRRMAADGVPSPDGRSLAFTAEGGRQIRLAKLDGGTEQTIARASSDQLFSQLVWSENSHGISFLQRIPIQRKAVDTDVSFDSSFRTIDIPTGRETAVIQDLDFDSAARTADGRLFYLRTWPSSELESRGLWVVNTDPSTGAFLGAPERLHPFGAYDLWTGISVSRHGKVTAIRQDWLPHIYVGQLNPDKSLATVHQLTNEVAGDFPHSWSADGSSVYFESDRIGRTYHLFRQQLDRSNAEMLTVGDNTQVFPSLMPDGTTLVYEEWKMVKGKRERSIVRANANAGEPKLVWAESDLDEWRCPEIAGTACVLRQIEGQRLFTYYVLDLTSGRGRELAHTAWQPTILGDWGLSPDSKTIAIPNHDEADPAIRLLALDGSQRETEIKVHQSGQLRGVHWAPDGQGFYSGSLVGPLHQLRFITLSGEARPVRNSNTSTWGLPSRDGKKLAFIDAAESRNVFQWR